MRNFQLVGMRSPGRINLPGFGTVELENISDELAERIWLSGCRYLIPTPEYRKKLYPDEKPISIHPLPVVNDIPASMLPSDSDHGPPSPVEGSAGKRNSDIDK